MTDGEETARARRKRQEIWLLFGMAVAFVLLGIVTGVGSVLAGVRHADHWRALQTSGTPLMADVVETRTAGFRTTDRLRIVYDFGGRHFDTWTPCAGPTGCRHWPGPQVKIWVDPADPADFVKDYENSSRWIGIRDEWFLTMFGATLLGFGAFGVILSGHGLRRRPVPAPPTAKPRRDGRRLGRRPGRLPRRRH